MKDYKDFFAIELGELESSKALDEGALRGLSAVALIAKIRKLGTDVQKTKNLNKRLELIANQNTQLAALIFAMTQFK